MHVRWRPQLGGSGLALTFLALLLAGTGFAQDTAHARDSALHHASKKYDFTLLMSLGGALGSYHNIAMQRSHPPTPLRAGSSAYILCGELGFAFRSLALRYYAEAVESSISTYVDSEGFNHHAGRAYHGPRTSYGLSHRILDLVPELGYVFLSETAAVVDTRKERSDQYREESSDQGYSYGLSVRRRVIPGGELELLLCGRYVHDHLDIRTDNYWLGLDLLGLVYQVSGPGGFPPMQTFRLGLSFRWTERTDGRSDRFLALSLAGTYGLF
jgi:hypothetical protein